LYAARAETSISGTLIVLSAIPASVAGAPLALFIYPKRKRGPQIRLKTARLPKRMT
jgi:hypothetical protein